MARVGSGKYVDAAISVLESLNRPMRSRELFDEALTRGLFEPTGENQALSFETSLNYYIRNNPQGKLAKALEPGLKRSPRGGLMYTLRIPSDQDLSEEGQASRGAKTEVPESTKKTVHAVLTSMKQYLSQEDKPKISEADTKANFIEPIIAALGWGGIGVVVREYYVKNSQEFIDYVMTDKGKSVLAIEAKALQVEITEKAAAQIVQYCVVEGIEWAALTNGRELRLFNTFLQGDLAAKAVLRLDLLAFNNDAEYDSLFSQLWLLSRESMTTPAGVRSWMEQQRIDRAIRSARLNPATSAIKALRKHLAEDGIKASPEEIVQWFRTQISPSMNVIPIEPQRSPLTDRSSAQTKSEGD